MSDKLFKTYTYKFQNIEMNMRLSRQLKIDSKTSLIHFLPKELSYLTETKKIQFKEKNLKTSYLIDIINKFISKYFFAEKIFIRLSSEVLRKNYGTFYNYYLNYLKENDILRQVSNYCAGKFCSTYTMNKKYFKENIIRFKNIDKILLRKWKENFLSFEIDSMNENKIIDPWIKKKLIYDLEHVEIDLEGASAELNRLYESGEIKYQSYWKNMLSVESIDNGSLFYIEDDYGRLHTNFTVLKKVIRSKYLKIEGEEVEELDIKNSQPIFFAKFMKDCGLDKDEKYKEEYFKYLNLVQNGRIYEEFMAKTGLTRSECKPLIFKVFFGKNKIDKKNKNENAIFKSMFPNLFDWITWVKSYQNDYKALVKELQLRESKLIFGNICYKIKKDVPSARLFTVHDSIFFPKKHEDKINKIFYHYVEMLFD
jgi:hypothetical protein